MFRLAFALSALLTLNSVGFAQNRGTATPSRPAATPSASPRPAAPSNPAPLVYSQSTGRITQNGTTIGTGYSGAGHTAAQGRNNPQMQGTPNVGPIPTGNYNIGAAHASRNTGPMVMNLTPSGHNAQGRSGFQIHGNNATNNASHGCIILPPNARSTISNNGNTRLRVVP